MRWRSFGGLLLVVIAQCALGGLLFRPVPVLAAPPAVARRAAPVDTPQPQPTPANTPAPGTTPAATATPAPTTTVVENIFHIIQFPFQTMMDAVVQMSNKILLQSYKEAGQRFSDALEVLVLGPYGIAPTVASGSATPLFANLVYPHWKVTLAIALLLLPVTLMLTAVSALRLGATSALGLADLKEALLGWLISVGAASSSYYLLGLAHRLSAAAALSVLSADFGARVTGATLAAAFFNVNALLALAGNLMTSPIVLYLAFFALFLASSVMLGLGLALAAYTALAYLLTTLAPLVLVLGVLPPLRWLQVLWLKSVAVTFLIPVVDSLLLKAAVSMFYNLLGAEGSGNIGTFVAGVFITAGVVSVLITINFKVGEMVFGALGEVHRQAMDATLGVVKLAAVAAGMAVGGLAIGAGGAAVAGTGGGGEAGAAVAGSQPQMAGGPGGAAAGPSTATSANGSREAAASHSAPMSAHGESDSSTGIGRRMTQLLGGSTPATPNAPGDEGQAPRPAGDDQEQSEAGEQVGNSARATGVPPAAGRHAGGPTDQAPNYAGHIDDAQGRRARLVGSFGRALAHNTRNPVMQGLGIGLQAGELAGSLRASSDQPSGQGGAHSSERTSEAVTAGALRWSNRDLSHLPNDLFDPGRDNTELMAGGLHQAFVSSGRAMRTEDTVKMAQESYGQWRQQGQPGGMAAQRELFEAMLDLNNKAEPQAFVESLQDVATRHGFSLGDRFTNAAQSAFDRSQDAGTCDLPGATTQRRS
jgi:hypothetical protein